MSDRSTYFFPFCNFDIDPAWFVDVLESHSVVIGQDVHRLIYIPSEQMAMLGDTYHLKGNRQKSLLEKAAEWKSISFTLLLGSFPICVWVEHNCHNPHVSFLWPHAFVNGFSEHDRGELVDLMAALRDAYKAAYVIECYDEDPVWIPGFFLCDGDRRVMLESLGDDIVQHMLVHQSARSSIEGMSLCEVSREGQYTRYGVL